MPKKLLKIKNTGLVLHQPDEYRDLTFSDVLQEAELPKDFDLPDLIPDYQNGVPKCVMESVSYLAQQQNYDENSQIVQLSADAGYVIAKMLYDKNKEYGTTLLTGVKVLCDVGLPEDDIFSDNEELWNNPDKYFDLNRITEVVKENAAQYRSQTYIRGSGIGWGNVVVDEIKQMIFQRKGCIVAIGGDNSFYGERDGFVKPPSSIVWQHAIVLKGWKYFDNRLFFKLANWWDKDKKGKPDGSGFGWLDWELWRSFVWGNYTTVDVPNDTFAKIKMWKLLQVEGNNRIYLEFLGEHYWIDDMKKIEKGIETKKFTPVQKVNSSYPLKIVGEWRKFPFLKDGEYLMPKI